MYTEIPHQGISGNGEKCPTGVLSFSAPLGHLRDMVPNYLGAWRKHRDMSQDDLAAAIGTTKSMYGKLERGERTLDTDWLGKLASALRCEPFELIATLPGERPHASAQDDSDEIEIQEWDIAYGMGGGTYLDLPVTGQKHKFSASWLRNFTHAPPEMVFLARGAGDSMFPTIWDSDIVIVDTSDREVRMGDKIWAVVYGTTGYIKRIRPMADGSVKMLSDNPNVPPETAYDGELVIVGRVVAIVRKQ